MSDERQNSPTPAVQAESTPTQAEAAPMQAAAPAESLDSVEDIDFLLEEIENKIAPLALA